MDNCEFCGDKHFFFHCDEWLAEYGEPPFICVVCDIDFYTNEGYTEHQTKHTKTSAEHRREEARKEETRAKWCGTCQRYYYTFAIDHVAYFHNPFFKSPPQPPPKTTTNHKGPQPPRPLTEKEQKLWAFATQDVSPNERNNAQEMLRKKGLWN